MKTDRYWRFRCKECGGTGWKYDSEELRACFEGDHAQLSVTAATYVVDAWPTEVTVGDR